jgi:hypothetical protein
LPWRWAGKKRFGGASSRRPGEGSDRTFRRRQPTKSGEEIKFAKKKMRVRRFYSCLCGVVNKRDIVVLPLPTRTSRMARDERPNENEENNSIDTQGEQF